MRTTLLLGVCLLAFLPPVGLGQGSSLRKRVLIVGLDGVRADALQAASTPTIDSLAANGAVSYLAQTSSVSSSGPGWSSLLTGVWINKHGVTNNSFSGSNFSQYPHFFTRLRQSCSQTFMASIVHWTPISTQILSDADLDLAGLSDAQVTTQCVQLLATGDPDVIFIHLDDTDAAGHSSGFSPTNPQYLNAISTSDARIGTVLAAIQSRPAYPQENWLIIISSDHGGLGTSHGGPTPQERTVPFIVSGPSTAQGTTIATPPGVVDVPPTVLAFLGVPVDPAWGWDGQAVGLSSAPTTPPSVFPCDSCTRGFQANANQVANTVDLSWIPSPPADATGFEVTRNGTVVATLPLGTASFTDSFAAGGAGAHLQLDYELRTLGGPVAAACPVLAAQLRLSTGDVRLFDDFDSYSSDVAVQGAGWQMVDENNPVEADTWTITNPGNRAHPAGQDGRPSSGGFLISDSDWGGSSGTSNPTGSGMSHDLWSPVFSCAALSSVFLHFDCSAALNNNGQAVFDVDVTTDGGASWNNAFRRVAPARSGTAPVVTTGNADGVFGALHIDLSPWAAGQGTVRFRIRHFEPNWDWFIAVDNVLVDDVDTQAGGPADLLPRQEFNSGLPGGWSIQGLNLGLNTWTSADPCNRSLAAAGASFPYLGGQGSYRLGAQFMILDSDCDPDPAEDELLLTPVIDCTHSQSVFLHFSSETLLNTAALQEVVLSLDGGQSFQPEPLFSYSTGALGLGEDPVFASMVLQAPEAAGQPSVVFGFRYQSPGNAGWWGIDDVRVSGDQIAASSAVIGIGCGGSPNPILLSQTLPTLGQSLTLVGGFAPASVPGILIFSPPPAQPVSVLPGCTVYVDLNAVPSWVQVPLTTSGIGAWTQGFPLPNDPALAGLSFVAQCVYLPLATPLGFALTNGLDLRLGY